MDTIFDAYDFSRSLTDKAGKGFLSPEEYGQWAGAAQMAMFNEARTAGDMDNRTQDLLAPFTTTASFAANGAGSFERPSEYVQELRIVSSTGKEYLPILWNELRDALASVLQPIDRYPRFTESDTGFTLYPNTAVTGDITYYRLPAQPRVGYDVNAYEADGTIVYNEAASTQLEIPKAYWPELIKRTLAYIGVNLSDADLFAFSQNAAS